MNLLQRFQARRDLGLVVEERIYEIVAAELAAGEIRQGLWTKATAQASSSAEADIQKKYIELRAEMILAEGRLSKTHVQPGVSKRVRSQIATWVEDEIEFWKVLLAVSLGLGLLITALLVAGSFIFGYPL